jgi:hypothetical protein
VEVINIGSRGPKKGEGGRPRLYSGEGAPQITLRLDPEDREWVRKQGGAGWLRRLIRELRTLSTDKTFARCWQRLQNVDDE